MLGCALLFGSTREIQRHCVACCVSRCVAENRAGISQLQARPNLEARIAFDLADGTAPYNYSEAQLLGDES